MGHSRRRHTPPRKLLQPPHRLLRPRRRHEQVIVVKRRDGVDGDAARREVRRHGGEEADGRERGMDRQRDPAAREGAG